MAKVTRKTRIVGALVVAGVFIAVATIVSSPNFTLPSLFAPATANAESTQELLQAYAQKDSDHDGLPDWEEALYGTDPYNAHSFSPDMTDGEAVAKGLIKPKIQTDIASSTNDVSDQFPGTAAAPGSLTDQFAQQFFTNYLTQQGISAQSPESDVETYAANAMQAFVDQHTHTSPYSLSDIHVNGSGSAALNSYAGSMEGVLAEYAVNSEQNELGYLSDAVNKNDSLALSQLAAIGKAYSSISSAALTVPVPAEAQYAQIEFVNATYKLGADITDMSTVNSDPLRTYIGLSQYLQDDAVFQKSLVELHTVFVSENVQAASSTPASIFINLTADIAANAPKQ